MLQGHCGLYGPCCLLVKLFRYAEKLLELRCRNSPLPPDAVGGDVALVDRLVCGVLAEVHHDPGLLDGEYRLEKQVLNLVC